jgi:hypothetical protein
MLFFSDDFYACAVDEQTGLGVRVCLRPGKYAPAGPLTEGFEPGQDDPRKIARVLGRIGYLLRWPDDEASRQAKLAGWSRT